MEFSLDEIRKACEITKVPREHFDALNNALIYLAGYQAGKAGGDVNIPKPPPPARKKPGRKPKPLEAAPPAVADADAPAPVSRWTEGQTLNGAAS